MLRDSFDEHRHSQSRPEQSGRLFRARRSASAVGRRALGAPIGRRRASLHPDAFFLRPLRSAAAEALAVACALSVFAAAAPTIDQLLSLKSVARPRISPDGKLVAYEVKEIDWK